MIQTDPHLNNLYNAQQPEYIRHFASGQMLAELAYELQEKIEQDYTISGTAWPLLEPSGAWRYYLTQPFQNTPDGLHGFIFTPASQAASEHTTSIKVAFRGTDAYQPASIFRDTDLFGPGISDHAENLPVMLDQLYQTIKNKQNVELTICGHSLGGADANYFFTGLLKEHLKTNKFHNIKKIIVNTFNAPGADKGLRDAAHSLLELNAVSNNPIKIIGKIGLSMVDDINDDIQTLGHNIFHYANPLIAEVHVLKTKKSNNHQTSYFDFLTPHGIANNYFSPSKPYGKINPNIKHAYAHNQNTHGQQVIDTELNTYPRLLFSFVRIVQKYFQHERIRQIGNNPIKHFKID